MKSFGNYQYVPIEPMSDRDKKEKGSRFWNKGKWDNFVLPFLPEDCSEMTFVDIGCNAGVFLELAEKKGFKKVIGIDNNPRAIRRAEKYKKKIGGKYEIRRAHMKRCLDSLPMSDYIVMAMTHYYLDIGDWYDFLDKLKLKAVNVIIVTADKRERLSKAGSDSRRISDYFKYWRQSGYIPTPDFGDDPFPRKQWSFCFTNIDLERVSMDKLKCLNPDLPGFYEEFMEKKDALSTKYFKEVKRRRGRKWRATKLVRYIISKGKLLDSIKRNGYTEPILVDSKNRIIDGAHRYYACEYLGYKSIIIRKIL